MLVELGPLDKAEHRTMLFPSLYRES